MATAETICTDLTDRIQYYQRLNHGKLPKNIPVTLDELAWLSEAVYGEPRVVPSKYNGVYLRMVAEVIELSGALVVRP